MAGTWLVSESTRSIWNVTALFDFLNPSNGVGGIGNPGGSCKGRRVLTQQ